MHGRGVHPHWTWENHEDWSWGTCQTALWSREGHWRAGSSPRENKRRFVLELATNHQFCQEKNVREINILLWYMGTKWWPIARLENQRYRERRRSAIGTLLHDIGISAYWVAWNCVFWKNPGSTSDEKCQIIIFLHTAPEHFLNMIWCGWSQILNVDEYDELRY